MPPGSPLWRFLCLKWDKKRIEIGNLWSKVGGAVKGVRGNCEKKTTFREAPCLRDGFMMSEISNKFSQPFLVHE